MDDIGEKPAAVPKAIMRLRAEQERNALLYASHRGFRASHIRLVEPEVLCITRELPQRDRPVPSEDGGKENQ